jgi:enoyl-CoA hydratase/carnithine racemase
MPPVFISSQKQETRMTIRTGVVDGVATIEIARPEKKNALTMAMYDAMTDAIVAAGSDPAVRALLITGQPGVFTSGNDLEDFMQRPPAGPIPPSSASCGR